MIYPDDGTMLFLLALNDEQAIRPRGSGLFVSLPGSADAPEPPGALDELEARGWVAIGETGAEVTEAGRYHLGRWMRTKYRTGRR